MPLGMAASPTTLTTTFRPTPQRIARFPYTAEELETRSRCPDSRIRRPAKMSLWLRTQPEPPRGSSRESRAIVAHYDNLSREAVAQCETSILEQGALKTRLPPSAHSQIDAVIEEIRYERNYMWWRLFRINDLPP